MKLQNIQKFIFQNAQYRVEDDQGALLLKIDYRKNTFEIETQTNDVSQTLQDEAKKVARDLLARKHGVNFAKNSK